MKPVVRKAKVAACLQKKHLLPRKQLKEADRQEHSSTENFTILEKFYSKTEILIREISKTVAHADKEY